jgi:hypothetical protein
MGKDNHFDFTIGRVRQGWAKRKKKEEKKKEEEKSSINLN